MVRVANTEPGWRANPRPPQRREESAGGAALCQRANRAAAEYRSALHILAPRSEHWHPPVLTYSAMAGTGLAELWQKILEHRTAMQASGDFTARRRQQQVKWMWSMLEDRLKARLRADPAIRAKVKTTEAAVADGRVTPALAAEQIAEMLR